MALYPQSSWIRGLGLSPGPKETPSSFLLPSQLSLLTQGQAGRTAGHLPASPPTGSAMVSLPQGEEEASEHTAQKQRAIKDLSVMCSLVSFPHPTD